MKLVIQCVSRGSVDVVDEQTGERRRTGEIGRGYVVLLGVGEGDTEEMVDRFLDKLYKLRVFPDENGKTNCSLEQVDGSVLVVSQFTLAADTERGMRPSFSKGASPDRAEALYDYFVERCRHQEMNTQTGRFAADMQVSLVNDGPVTFWLQV